jgi:hypothetical protein
MVIPNMKGSTPLQATTHSSEIIFRSLVETVAEQHALCVETIRCFAATYVQVIIMTCVDLH